MSSRELSFLNKHKGDFTTVNVTLLVPNYPGAECNGVEWVRFNRDDDTVYKSVIGRKYSLNLAMTLMVDLFNHEYSISDNADIAFGVFGLSLSFDDNSFADKILRDEITVIRESNHNWFCTFTFYGHITPF